MIQLVLFDLGGVLINWHDQWLFHHVSLKFDFSETSLTKECKRYMGDLHKGKIDEMEFWKIIGTNLRIPALANTKTSHFSYVFRQKSRLNMSLLSLANKIKESGIKIGILSNVNDVTYHIIGEDDRLSIFDFQFLSFKLGTAKPERRIFDYVIEKVSFPKESILFIDDKKSNVDAAQSVGINAIQYKTYAKLLKDLRHQEIL